MHMHGEFLAMWASIKAAKHFAIVLGNQIGGFQVFGQFGKTANHLGNNLVYWQAAIFI